MNLRPVKQEIEHQKTLRDSEGSWDKLEYPPNTPVFLPDTIAATIERATGENDRKFFNLLEGLKTVRKIEADESSR